MLFLKCMKPAGSKLLSEANEVINERAIHFFFSPDCGTAEISSGNSTSISNMVVAAWGA